MSNYQQTFFATLIACGWTKECALRLAMSEYVGRCVAQGKGAEDAARDMARLYPA